MNPVSLAIGKTNKKLGLSLPILIILFQFTHEKKPLDARPIDSNRPSSPNQRAAEGLVVLAEYQ
jgi:hypothetical protein